MSEVSKKRKITPKLFDRKTHRTLDDQNYVSGTDVRNYLLNDSLVDWLNLYHPKPQEEDKLLAFLFQRGNDFEKAVVDYINNKVCNVVYVSNTITPQTCQDTITHMQNGEPIIWSAPVRDEQTKTQGIIDLLVRSDYLFHLVENNPLSEFEQSIPAPKLNTPFHYVVIDIKFSSLPLTADGKNICNDKNYPAYKGQLWIYTHIVGQIQGYTSPYAFVIGRQWKYKCKGVPYSGHCFERFGVVDFEGKDAEYKERTQNAVDWVRDVRMNGSSWNIDNPQRPELYPNMCADSGVWNKVKKELALKQGDITMLWNCGVKEREKVFEHNITSWRDKRCTADKLGQKNKRGEIINAIIKINQQDNILVLPKKLKTELKRGNEIFVDFETIGNIFSSFDQLPEQINTDMIFMIGVFHNDKYINFVANKPTLEEEKRIMTEFVLFIRSLPIDTKIWIWYADENIWKAAENRQMDLACQNGQVEQADQIVDNWGIYNWVDLHKIFLDEPIVIKNCFGFGLKEVAGSLNQYGLIETKLDTECDSGIIASVSAWEAYETEKDPVNSEVMKDIARYNYFDVKVLSEILEYLRNNH